MSAWCAQNLEFGCAQAWEVALVPAGGGGSGSDLGQGLVSELLFGESWGWGERNKRVEPARQECAGPPFRLGVGRGKLAAREASLRALRLGPHLPRHIPPGLS